MFYKVSGVNSIIIYFGDTIGDDVFFQVNNAYRLLKEKNLNGIIELIPSYTTLFIEFDIFIFNHEKLFEKMKEFIQTINLNQKSLITREIEIPVYYSKEVGFDLDRVSKYNNLSIDEIIKIHSSKIYTVYTIGFAPAFGYMGSVDESIATPRLESPRKKVPRNSVAIADNQTAIYPKQSPGGWNVIGKTYIDMFDKYCENYSYLNVGDKVQFIPISREEFLENGGQI